MLPTQLLLVQLQSLYVVSQSARRLVHVSSYHISKLQLAIISVENLVAIRRNRFITRYGETDN